MPDEPTITGKERHQMAESILALLLAEIDARRIDVYRNVLEQPYIIFRVEDRPKGSYFLQSDSVRGWIADFAWDAKLGAPNKPDLDRIITVLLGRALRNNRQQIEDQSVLQILREEPVVAVILEFMFAHQSGSVETTMEALRKDLTTFATERQLMRLGRNRFPRTAQRLSKEINHYAKTLATLGIDAQIWRSNGSKVILTRRSDDSSAVSSAVSSDDNSAAHNRLLAPDAKVEQLARLQALKDKGRERDQKEER